MAYERINWQNLPSEATAINNINLNKMDSAIYDHDTRLTTDETAITNLQDGKVDKVNGKGLSQVDNVTVTQHVAYGTVVSTIKTYKQDGTEFTSQVCNGIVVDSALSDSSTNPVQNKVVKSAIDEKSTVAISDTLADGDTIANVTIDGETTPIKASQPKSEEMNVRSAMMLLTPPISNNAPYVKRVVGGGITNPYLCKLKKLIGASVVWNQLLKNGNFATTSGWASNVSGNTISASNNELSVVANTLGATVGVYCGNTNHPTEWINGHVYLVSAEFYSPHDTIGYIGKNNETSGAITANSWSRVVGIKNNLNGGNPCVCYVKANATVGFSSGEVIKFRNYMIFDLTAMFGSTIADYVYTLETQTAGSGIAWLKSYSFFTEDYYAYSANTIQSVSVSGKKNVGFNQCDEIFEIGGIVWATGQNTNANDRMRSINYCPVLGNTTYYGTLGNVGVFFYDSGKNYIGYVTTASGGGTVTTPSNTRYIRFLLQNTTTYGNDWCFNFSSSKNGTYEPYTSTTYPLDHTTLRGLFKLDANNNLYADGDIYPSDGNGSVNYEEIDLGSLTYQTFTGGASNTFTVVIPKENGLTNILCDDYLRFEGDAINMPNMSIRGQASSGNIYVRNTNCSTKEEMKTALDGVKLVYQLATPTTAELTPFTSLQNIESGGTEEFIDYGVSQGTRDVAIPCGQESEYNSSVEVPNLPTSGGKVELTYNPANGQFTWE